MDGRVPTFCFSVPLFNRMIGQIFAVSAVVMVILGFIIIRKIVTIEL